jgi:hypothetical protein
MGMWWVGWRQEGGKPRREEGNKKFYPGGFPALGVLVLVRVQYEHVNSPLAISNKVTQKERPKGYLHIAIVYMSHMDLSHSPTAHPKQKKNPFLSTTHSLESVNFICLPSLLPTQNGSPFRLAIGDN